MTARRKAAGIVALGFAPFALAGLAATPALAHGSLTDPVSRVSAVLRGGAGEPGVGGVQGGGGGGWDAGAVRLERGQYRQRGRQAPWS
ncbi:hypothetical protein SMICM304S_08845 [Streptomyces microflavus]